MWRGVRKLADQNPVVMGSWVRLATFVWWTHAFVGSPSSSLLLPSFHPQQIMGITALLMPMVVVPVRRGLGFKTNQYDKMYH
jgi:hypothetical protein